MKRLILLAAMAVSLTGTKAQNVLYPNEFALQDVKLLDSPFKHAMDLNVKVLLEYDVDRLLAPFLKESGLEPKGEPFSNWEGLDGHVGGHYLSALAIHYAATGNPELKKRMDYMLSELALCAAARNDGYIGGVPNGDILWDEIRKGNVQKVWEWWVPWYNVHKTYAGLRDAYVYTGSKPALNMFLNFCDWAVNLTDCLTDEQMQQMLGCEFGGMNEMFADAYDFTGDEKYLRTAGRFTHHDLYDGLHDGVDNLDNRHANTQVPKVVGFQRVGESAGDPEYTKTADFFWNTVVHNRSLSIGGNSRREHFASAADAKSYVDDREGPESCNTNNMLKLTEGLFRQHPDSRYADFYERALYNHILSTQHPEHGGYVYFTSARPGHYRVYSKPNSAMWCCVGTGMENHGKYGQFIYTHSGDSVAGESLWVNLFIPSELNWREKGVKVRQENNFPQEEATALTVNLTQPATFTMNLRKPVWSDNVRVSVNGKPVKTVVDKDGYIALNREWNDGDRVEMMLPMHVEIEELAYLPQYVSIVRGPIVMAARYEGPEDLPGLIADDHRWGHIAHGELVSVFDTPLLIGERKDLKKKLNAMKPVEGKPMTYKIEGVASLNRKDSKGDKTKSLTAAGEVNDILLEPFANIHDSRYILYWLSMTPKEYAAYQVTARKDEEMRLALDARTVDAVNTGEQQPEADHGMKNRNSGSGNFNGEPWRDASSGGHFSYEMSTEGKDNLKLRVRYWGNETGPKKFNILIDDQPLASVDNSDKWNSNEFIEEEYEIPSSMLSGKKQVNVKFTPEQGNSTGSIYHVRLLNP